VAALPNGHTRWEARERARIAAGEPAPVSPIRRGVSPPDASSGTTGSSGEVETGEGDPSAMGDPPDEPKAKKPLRERMEHDAKKRRKQRLRRMRLADLRPTYEREEITTVGFDDYLQGVASDPYGTSTNTGIRIPKFPGVRYLIVGAVADLNAGDRVVAWGKLLTIASEVSRSDGGSGPPFYPVEINVETVPWRFIDGAASFHLMKTPLVQQVSTQGPADQDSFVFEDAGTSALVYETATGATGPAGYLGLTGYTPPVMIGQPIIAARDVRDPFQSGAMEYLNWEADRPMRIRAYIAVLQTNPATRLNPPAIPDTNFVVRGIPAEESHLQIAMFRSVARYWRAGVRLVIDRRIR
jgi:hypothetical protein